MTIRGCFGFFSYAKVLTTTFSVVQHIWKQCNVFYVFSYHVQPCNKIKKIQQIFLDCFQEYISIQYVNLSSIYHICQTIFHFPVSLYHAFCKKIRILEHMYAVSITFIYIIKSKRLLECLVIMLFQKRAFWYGYIALPSSIFFRVDVSFDTCYPIKISLL